MENPDKKLKRGLIMLGVGFLLDGLWILEGALLAQMRKIHLNYVLFICRLNYIIVFILFLGRLLIEFFLNTLIYGCFTLLSFSIHLPPTH